MAVGKAFRFRQRRPASDPESSILDARREVAGCGDAGYLHGLAGLQIRLRAGGVEVNEGPGGFVLNENVPEFDVGVGDNSVDIYGVARSRLFDCQTVDLIGPSQNREPGTGEKWMECGQEDSG